jgi:hypothetical protein
LEARTDGQFAEAPSAEDHAELASARAFAMAGGKCMLQVCYVGVGFVR